MLDRVVAAITKVSTDLTIDWRLWAAIASALVAFLALILGLANRRTAREALRLSQRQEERRSPRLDLSLLDALSWRPVGTESRVLGAKILAVNPTDRDGALVEIDLHVTYGSSVGVVTTVKVPHGGDEVRLPEPMRPLDVPSRLAANDAITGWLAFNLHNELTGGRPIDRVEIVVRDSRGVVEHLSVWNLREVVDDEAS